LWHASVGHGRVSALEVGPQFVVAAADDAVVAFDRSTGHEVWRRTAVRSRVSGNDQTIVIEPIDTAAKSLGSLDLVSTATGAEIRHIDDVWTQGVLVATAQIAFLTAAGHGAEGRLVLLPVSG